MPFTPFASGLVPRLMILALAALLLGGPALSWFARSAEMSPGELPRLGQDASGSACQHREAAPADAPKMPATVEGAALVKHAGVQIFLKTLSSTGDAGKGVFMSPASIHFALALALNAAGPSSTTYAQLKTLLQGDLANGEVTESAFNEAMGRLIDALTACVAGPDGQGSEFIIGNSIWSKTVEVQPAYAEAMKSIYKATARHAKGSAEINVWVSEVTKGMIKELISTENFDAVLANALYFKGLWENAFKKEVTAPRQFTTGAGAAKEVPMMLRTFEPRELQGLAHDAFSGIVLPYKGGDFSAILLLPKEGTTPAAAIEAWASGNVAPSNAGKLKVIMPKFKVESTMSLTGTLKALGVTDAFSGSANLERLSSDKLFVSDVVHKCVVEVDEEGTVAAAATAVMMTRSMPLPPQEIVFDRPFVFIISHVPTGTPAFMGVVHDPSV